MFTRTKTYNKLVDRYNEREEMALKLTGDFNDLKWWVKGAFHGLIEKTMSFKAILEEDQLVIKVKLPNTLYQTAQQDDMAFDSFVDAVCEEVEEQLRKLSKRA